MAILEAIVIAGPNGAGKTTFARQMLPLIHPGVPFINADEIQRALGLQGTVAAAREFLRRLSEAEANRQSFAIETTLSSRSYAARIARWKSLGYSVTLHFIQLPSAEYAVARVTQRARLGGHTIPEEDIRRRFDRGARLFEELYKSLVPEWYHWHSDDQGLRLAERS